MGKLNILILFDFAQEKIDEIKEVVPEAEIILSTRENVTENQLEKAEIIYGWPTEEQIKKAENLKWLQIASAGANRYLDRSIYCNSDIVLTNSSGVFGLPIAEHVLAMIFAFNRNLDHYIRQQQENKWERKEVRGDLYGSTVGVIGLGDIGSEVAKRAHNLGTKVIAVKRTMADKPDYVDELYTDHDLDLLLTNSDYIVLTVPLTAETRGMISEEKLKKMKKEAFLVNIGRGDLVDQDALIKALKEGWIAGAGLDVTSPEPLPENSELWNLNNVIITPHTSGGSPTDNERRIRIFKENLNHYTQGKDLINVVDFELGY